MGSDSMKHEKYENGNVELLSMLKSKTFDRAIASRIIAGISDLNKPILNLTGHATTYLFEAETYNNVDAVRFLLENGADPNLDIPDLINDCPLTDLHFLWQEMGDEMEQRLEIVKLFFTFGADPNLLYDGESLYDHVEWEMFYQDVPHDLEYLKRFFLILLAYGGGKTSSSDGTKLTEEIDKTQLDQYDFKLFPCEDGYHLEGHIFNPDGVDIGIV